MESSYDRNPDAAIDRFGNEEMKKIEFLEHDDTGIGTGKVGRLGSTCCEFAGGVCNY